MFFLFTLSLSPLFLTRVFLFQSVATVTKTIEHFRAEQERLLHEIEDLKREETTLSARLSATQHDSSELDRAFQDLDTISMTTIPTFGRILHSPGKDAKG